jgi:hypothetical protein
MTDFVSSAVEKFRGGASDADVRHAAYEQVKHLFRLPVGDLAEDSTVALLWIGETVHAGDRPEQTLTRAIALTRLLRQEVDRSADRCVAALLASVPDYLASELQLQRNLEQLAQLARAAELSDESQRQAVVSTYQRFLEGIWRPLAHILLQIADVAAAKRETYEPLSQKAALLTIYERLAAQPDQRYKDATSGVNRELRNAEAHADIDYTGDGVEFTTGNRASGFGRAKLLDAHLLGVLADLVQTCAVVSAALQVLYLESRVDTFATIERDPQRFAPLLRPAAEAFLSLVDLSVLSLRSSEGDLEIRASVTGVNSSPTPDRYLQGIAALAPVLTPVETFRLQVEHRGEVHWCFSVSASAARHHNSEPGACAGVLDAVFQYECRIVTSPPHAERCTGYVGAFLKPLIRSLLSDVIDTAKALDGQRPASVLFTRQRADCYRQALDVVTSTQPSHASARRRFENVVFEVERSVREMRRKPKHAVRGSREMRRMVDSVTRLSAYIDAIPD